MQGQRAFLDDLMVTDYHDRQKLQMTVTLFSRSRLSRDDVIWAVAKVLEEMSDGGPEAEGRREKFPESFQPNPSWRLG